jgi:hypothetical protein
MMKFKSLFLAAVVVSMTAIAAMAQVAPPAKPGITPYASLRYFMGVQYHIDYALGERDSKDLDMKLNQVLHSRAGLAFRATSWVERLNSVSRKIPALTRLR